MGKCRKLNDLPSVLKSDLPSLGDITKAQGFDFTQAYLDGWIINLREFLNIGKKMTDAQTHETAMLIIDTYPSLKISDINLIFKRVKLGKFGKIYDRLDGQLILSWFDVYFAERCDAAANMSEREADRYKESGRGESFEHASKLANKFRFNK